MRLGIYQAAKGRRASPIFSIPPAEGVFHQNHVLVPLNELQPGQVQDGLEAGRLANLGRGFGALFVTVGGNWVKTVDKPWGRELWWAVTEHYVGKILEVKAGHSLSLQYHVQKHETMLFHQGTGDLILGEETVRIEPGKVVTIEPGTLHKVIAETDLTILEVSTPHLDDVVRVKDDYGRAAPPDDPRGASPGKD